MIVDTSFSKVGIALRSASADALRLWENDKARLSVLIEAIKNGESLDTLNKIVTKYETDIDHEYNEGRE